MRGLEKPFFINNRESLSALSRALHKVDYNTWSSGHRTKGGKQFIGLSWDYDADNDWSKKWDKRGIIIFQNDQVADELFEDVETILGQNTKTKQKEVA